MRKEYIPPRILVHSEFTGQSIRAHFRMAFLFQNFAFLFQNRVSVSECRFCFRILSFGFRMSFQFQNAVSFSEYRVSISECRFCFRILRFCFRIAVAPVCHRIMTLCIATERHSGVIKCTRRYRPFRPRPHMTSRCACAASVGQKVLLS